MICRSSLPRMQELVSQYGYKLNRSGFMKCPFHNEKTPSLKVYPEGKGFFCFGCQAGGSVIDFVMKLFDLDYKTAMDKISDDFSIGTVRLSRYQKQKIKIKKNAEAEKHKQAEEHYWKMFDEYARLDRNQIRYRPKTMDEPLHELFVEALQKLCYQEFLLTLAEMRLNKYEHR